MAVCHYQSYTKAAEYLHITQPAVSQHIKFLEDYYDCQLFEMRNRKLFLTAQGKLLRDYAETVSSDAHRIKEKMQQLQAKRLHLKFGATLSVGEYAMPRVLSQLIQKYEQMTFEMSVANTKTLLKRLNAGELDFIIVEGLFDKSQYETRLFSKEPFVAICSSKSEILSQSQTLESLQEQPLIIREQGSGTREILIRLLEDHNLSVNMFKRIMEIGNMSAIKQMVAHNLGISFMFSLVVQEELTKQQLSLIPIGGFNVEREFNFVTLKGSFFNEQYDKIYELMRTEYQTSNSVRQRD